MAHQRSGRDDANFLNLEHEEALEAYLSGGLPDQAARDGFSSLLASATVYIFYAGTLPNRTRDRGRHTAIPVVSWTQGDVVVTPCFTSLAAIRRCVNGRATFSPIFMPELLAMLGSTQLVVNPGSTGERSFTADEIARLRALAPPYRDRTRRTVQRRENTPLGNLEGLFRTAGDD